MYKLTVVSTFYGSPQQQQYCMSLCFLAILIKTVLWRAEAQQLGGSQCTCYLIMHGDFK